MALFNKKRDVTIEKEVTYNSLQSNPYIDELVEHYKTRLLTETNLDTLTALSEGEKRLTIERLISAFMSEEKVVIPRYDKETMLARLIDESVGFGPLEPLLNDDSITEILINGPAEVFIEKQGRLQRSDVNFRDEAHVRHIIDRVVAPLGRRIDESSPMVDARLPDGSRVNAVIPPISLNGTLVSIRKFRKTPFEMQDLLNFDSLDETMATFLQAIVEAKMNVLISGGTGSGKTTFLNAVAKSIPIHERVITIEDSAELRLNRGSVVGLEARPANVEGRGEITIRQLVKNALRMRPDRIIVGEVRGSEAFDMLQAMNTGHEGSLTTVHANSPSDALSRVEGMVIMAGMDLPSHIVREYIVGALDYIIQAERLSDGKRKITHISEVSVDEQNKVQIRDIFHFKRTGMGANGEVLGYHTATGLVPKALERLRIFGIHLDEVIFRPKEEELVYE
ncbi:CpaF family protein [Pradoshia sp. D12]|uniref:CpaF family protein n=1 Tax=Bacillaceae TaxID=186817 RepID=UPI00080AC38D|nr:MULTISPECIES: CpaF family protein [Bacillaceae]OCA80728.1 type II secretion system protein E [Bacillus sp. FJAT-27986]QFK70062.1 CpaF family protein [Pradoshia sp. D12]TPF70622.1 CpaF family protein [Bacillus sp. D12]